MRICRKAVLILLCLCLTVGGRSFAMPVDASMSSSDVSTESMQPTCPEMDEAMPMPSMDESVDPIRHSKPDCCKTNACQCAAAHGFAMAAQSVVALRARIVETPVLLPRTAGYASPVLARLSRPPIA